MKSLFRPGRAHLAALLVFLLSLSLCAQASYGQTARVTAIAGGGSHTVILKEDGTVWAWGRNDHGQLGNGSIANSALPVQVKDPGGFGYLSDIVEIAAGENHTVARQRDGTVWAWGANSRGQLGDRSTEDKTTPVKVRTLKARVIAAGKNHTVAVGSDNKAYAWGANNYGQLGDNSKDDRAEPVAVSGLANISAVAAGENHTACISGGRVYAWGANNYGQLGDATYVERSEPVPILSEVTGKAQAIATKTITLAGDASSANEFYTGMTISITGGWDGNGTITKYAGSTRKATVTWVDPPKTFAPTDNYNYSIPICSNATAIACGKDHTVALTADGTAWLWGYNGFGQLGDKTTISKNTPIRISAPNNILDISAGEWHTVFLKNDGTVWSCGRNDHKQLGSASADSSTPVQVRGLSAITDIDAGGAHSLALMPDGKLYGWGSYQYGQIGDTASADSAVPVLIDTTAPAGNDFPTVITTDPADNARNIITSKAISVTFSESILEGPYYKNIRMDEVAEAGNPENVTISTAITGGVLKITPSSMKEDKKYKVYIPANAVKNLSGNALKDSYTFSFCTTDNTRPEVVSSIPANGDSAVDVSIALQASFNKDMDPLTINGDTFTLHVDEDGDDVYEKNVPGLVSYNVPTRTATFVPKTTLSANTEYKATITPLAGDLSGNRLAAAYEVLFATAADNTAPVVISHSPERNEQDVPLNKIITVNFSKGLDTASLDASKVSVKYADAEPPSCLGVSIDGDQKTVRIRFSEKLVDNTAGALKAAVSIAADGTNYLSLGGSDTVSIVDNTLVVTFDTALVGDKNQIEIAGSSLKDAAGNILANEFSTDAFDADGADPPPEYLGASIDPADNKKVTLTFSENIADNITPPDTLKEAVTFAADGSNFCALGDGDTVSISSNTLVVTFDKALAGNSNRLKIEADALKDNADNVISVDVTTEPIVGEPFATLSVNGNQLAITPDANYPLGNSTPYNVSILAGAVEDSAGNILAGDYSFKFTTVSDNSPPNIGSIDPNDGAAGVSIDKTIQITFNENIQPGSAWNSIKIQAGGSTPVVIIKSISGDTLTISPVQNLDILTQYVLTIPAGAVTDMAGNILPAGKNYTFTTGTLEDVGVKFRIANGVYGIPGQTVEVPVTIENGGGLTGFQFVLVYDKDILSLTGVNKGGALESGWQLQHSDNSTDTQGKAGVIGFMTHGNSPVDAGEAASLLFLVQNNAAEGDSPLSFEANSSSVDPSKSVSTHDGRIIITRRQLGDVNGDGVVNVQDVMLVIRFSLNELPPDALQNFAADINRDNVINVLDVVQITNKALGR